MREKLNHEYGECVDCENCTDNTCPGKKKRFIQQIKENLFKTTGFYFFLC